ncbi:sensor histidine kinase [Pseudaminobacter soli (ex Li et al. 2025)]|uniref:sensor histidine kinase n=1 Tax=Pseudaminobacter soli (ex Li et al. 2025) TaxID=1295366 RepID=UPI003CD03D71
MQRKLKEAQGLPADVLRAVNDDQRIAVLRDLQLADAPADADFDRLTTLAAALMQAPIAFVSLIESDRQWFKSCLGIGVEEIPIGVSFCAHAIAGGDEVFVVPDATADPRFADNPLVTGSLNVRFYAGAPIIVSGEAIGTLSVVDTKPRPTPDENRIGQLHSLAALAASLFKIKEDNRTGLAARAALAREEKRRVVAVEAASLASWAWDLRTDTIECDTLFPELLDLPPTTRLSARRIFRAIDRRDVKKAEAEFRAALATDEEYIGEYRVAGVHPTRWLAARGRVIEHDEEGNPLLIFGVNFDISERKAAEERQHLLLRELNHRVKNTLATVQALATQSVRHAQDPAEFLVAFTARLRALGRAHGLLSDHEWRGIALCELIRLEVLPFDEAENPRIRVSGEHLLLSPDQALGLGLVLHELGGNALQHGSLSNPDGVVDLSWRVEGNRRARRLVLTWVESGGPRVEPPHRQGFGSILIRRSLSKILASEVRHEYLPEGVRAEISMPLVDF